MKLHYAAASPFVRKVLVTAHELGLSDMLELSPVTVTPVAPDETVTAANSLGKIPTLVLDDGSAVFDSRVICEYLARQAGDEALFPVDTAGRTAALTLQALADGLCDTGVALRYETALRPAELRWQDWIDAQRQRLARVFDQLEADWADYLDTLTIGTIATGCALGYIDFRFADLTWRDGRPRLAAWYQTFSERPSMRATGPE